MAKKKKDLDVNVDTANADLKVTRKEGKTAIDLDTNVVDVHYEKDAEGKKLKVTVEPGAALNLVRNVLTRVINKKRG
jgi:hypothetical protein